MTVDGSKDRSPTRERILSAMASLLAHRQWSEVSVSDVASAAGVSRQTIYNEFGSRSVLADLYVEALLDQVVREYVPVEVVQDLEHALEASFRAWFRALEEGSPLVDSLPALVADETWLLETATARLASAYGRLFSEVATADATAFARLVVRLCFSFLTIPPAPGEDPVPALVAALSPYADTVVARSRAREQ
ncbi:hypothetical protein ASD84_13745 [Nocardioides sp. Root682]|nr:hypothetical protein ASD84_13745 [Nocardioides sp. Root682]